MDLVIYRKTRSVRRKDLLAPEDVLYRVHEVTDRLCTMGLHPPLENTDKGWGEACSRFMGCFYARMGIEATHWVGVLKGWTVEYFEVDMSDAYKVALDVDHRPSGPAYINTAFMTPEEIKHVFNEVKKERPTASVRFVSLDGRQAEIDKLGARFPDVEIETQTNE
jgi:hypothetical protein